VAELLVETRLEDGRAVIALRGEFDMAAVPKFERELAAAEAGEPDEIVVDLDGLSFMDSSGLRALVAADDRARRQKRTLAIRPGPPSVRRVFEITQLTDRLNLVA
jgi:anti-anti-sigma factor